MCLAKQLVQPALELGRCCQALVRCEPLLKDRDLTKLSIQLLPEKEVL